MDDLFTRVDKRYGFQEKKSSNRDLPLHILHKLECRACPLNEVGDHVNSPKMQPEGSSDPLVYVLGKNPTIVDDEAGEPFSGRIGAFIRSELRQYAKKARYNYIVRTRASKTEYSSVAIECCRPSIIRDIEESAPAVIIAVGGEVLRWLTGIAGSSAEVWRGRIFPLQIGKHACWVMPMLDSRALYDGYDSELNKDTTRVDFKKLRAHLKAKPEPRVAQESDYSAGVELLTKPSAIVRAIDEMAELDFSTIDLETSKLRPFSRNAHISIAAIGTFARTIAFPIHHPEADFSAKEKRSIDKAMCRYLVSKGDKCAHNTGFEIEWLVYNYGWDLIDTCYWHDTQAQAYVLDERRGCLSLEDQCMLHFGFNLKKLATRVNQADIDLSPLKPTMLYCGMDVKWTHALFKRQQLLIREQELDGIYHEHARRVPAASGMQVLGVLIDQNEVEKHGDALVLKRKQALDDIKACKNELSAFSKLTGKPFSPTSNADVKTMVVKVMKKSKSAKTDKGVLEKIDTPITRAVLALRGIDKQHGTYVRCLQPDSDTTVLFPDGKIHAHFNTVFTTTGRLSSSDPNLQNWPKRTNKHLRSVFTAPDGYSIVSIDYGQIEVRVIAMLSKDPTLVQYLWDDFDMHQAWAERVVELTKGKILDRRDIKGDMKKLRTAVKNELVFPLFYGSVADSIANNLKIDRKYGQQIFDRFWKEFPQVKAWQEQTRGLYRESGYVEGITGRRRRGPLNDNMVINTPIQGSASDIVVDGMVRLAEESRRTQKVWKHPRINIHDDLTFYVPDKGIDKKIKLLAKRMSLVPYSWVNVPLTVEVEVGKNWADMKEYGKFTSTQFTGDSK